MLQLTLRQADLEIERITAFLAQHLSRGEKAVVGISGGLDSDVVARLTAKAIGPSRLKLFIALQEGMDPRHLTNAGELAKDIGVSLVEINLTDFPFAFILAMQQADPAEQFRPDGLLDPSRAKCSVRTVVFSTYVDRGYTVIGTLNRTQKEIGMTMPFGDGASHIMPIVHLYRTQERQLAKRIGVSLSVLIQPSSSGSWLGTEELEDTAFWLYNQSPIIKEIIFGDDEIAKVRKIQSHLNIELVDSALLGLAHGMGDEAIERESGLPVAIVARLRKLTAAARLLKHRPLDIRLENLF